MTDSRARTPLASTMDTVRVAASVLLPILAEGVIRRRPAMVAVAERLDTPRWAVREMQRLRDRYGAGPLRLRVPGRRVVLPLVPDDVHRLLAESPEPFAPASRDKRAALAHFEPDAVLITPGERRGARRRINESVLDSAHPRHRLAERITRVVREETARLLATAAASGGLRWPEFAPAYQRIVRRVVLGEAARDDQRLTDLLDRLRSDANWGGLRPRRGRTYREFTARLRRYLDAVAPGSLAGELAGVPAAAGTAPYGQVPHWLFAFDAAGMAAMRALAMLASHPEALQRVRDDPTPTHDQLRAGVLESLRLWPTTLVILRDSTAPTSWRGARLPAGTTFVVVSSFFHRDDRTLPYADSFSPGVWTRDRPASLVPFSDGPGRCPGENLVLLVTSTMLAAMLDGYDFQLRRPALAADRPLRGELDPYRLRFGVRRRPTR